MTAAGPRDGLHGLVAKWRKQAEADQKRANDLRDRCDLEVAALRLGYATVQRECADELEQALAHARPEAVDEAMVDRACRVLYNACYPGHQRMVRAALIAALTPERAP